MDKAEKILAFVLVLVCLAIVIIVACDALSSHTETQSVMVVSKLHTPSRVDMDGTPTTEKFEVSVRHDGGATELLTVTKLQFMSVREGEYFKLTCARGGLTGMCYNVTFSDQP